MPIDASLYSAPTPQNEVTEPLGRESVQGLSPGQVGPYVNYQKRKKNLPTESTHPELDKQKAVNAVVKAYNLSKGASLLDLERFARYYRLFRNYQSIKNYQGLANLFVPEPYKTVRKKTAKLANAIRSIECIPNGQNDVQSAKIGTHLLNFLRRKMNWHMIERTAIQESRVVGLSWLKCLWQVDREAEAEPWKGFDVTFATVDRVFLDPESNLIDVYQGTNKWLIHDYEATYDDLAKNPNYDKEALELLKTQNLVGKGGSRYEQNPLSQARLAYYVKAKGRDFRTKKFQVLEYWGKYDPDQTGVEEDYLIVVVNRSIPVRVGLNPYKDILENPIPFVPIVANLVGQEMYPVGDLEPAESLFNELNDTRNQRMDTVTLNIDPAKEVLRSANIKPEDLIARKGWIINSNIPNGIRFVPPDMQGVRASIDEEKAIRGDIQQVTGVIDFAPGNEIQAGVSIDTARGTMIAKGEADSLLEDELNLLKTSLRMLYKIVLSYSQVFLDRQFTMRVMEGGVEQFYNVDKTTIQGNLDLDVEMKTLQDKTTDQQLKLLLFNQAKTTPGAAVGKFFTDLLESFYENVNIQEYYQPPQPQAPEAPKVSISLKGELNSMESDEIFKTIPGVDAKAADPLLRQDLREAMRGNLPEHHERMTKQMELMGQQKDLMGSMGMLPEEQETEPKVQ